MIIAQLFIEFINTILKFKIMDISLIDYLIVFAIIIFIFKIIQIVANSQSSSKIKKNKEKE